MNEISDVDLANWLRDEDSKPKSTERLAFGLLRERLVGWEGQ